MSDLQDIYKSFYDSFQDKEPLLDCDNFLVGGASDYLLPKKEKSLTWQLSNIRTVEDLKKNKESESLVKLEDDLDSFIVDKIDIVKEEQYEQLFFAMKKKAFDIFNFLEVKSSLVGNVPIREKDLVLTEDDYYVIDYLKRGVTDYFIVSSMALLSAFNEMGIETVKFRQLDDCPVCKACDGLFFEVRSLMNLLISGNPFSHKYCDYKLIPVIFRELYRGPLLGHLNLDKIEISNKIVINMPLELREDLESIVENIPFGTIEFVDMKKYLTEGNMDSEGVVLVLRDDCIKVHNSYVGFYGPVDFLKEFLKVDKKVSISEVDLEKSEIFFLQGRKVAKWDGKYWDLQTKECVK